jgi:hypothetical protein
MNKNQRDYQLDVAAILGTIENLEDSSLRSILAEYLKLSRRYYTPLYFPQDLDKEDDRFCDLIGGFPFTSVDFPWPIDPKTGDYLQPIVQLSLSKVGELLRKNLGRGLIQVWGYSAEANGHSTFELITIPDGFKQHVLSDFFPNTIARSVDFVELNQKNPKILWRSGGAMFLSNFEHVRINQDDAFAHLDSSDLKLIDMEFDAFGKHSGYSISEAFEILDHMRNLPYSGTYLGGHGGGPRSHGIDPQDGIQILRFFNEENDCAYDLTVQTDGCGKYIFDFDEQFMG